MKTVEVPAGTVEYHETGEGPPVVLLHGLLMDHRIWVRVLPLLPTGFRYIRPVLPLGAHRLPMGPGADLTPSGQVELLADLLDALDLASVTLVHNDWGEGLFLTAHGRDQRVSRQVITTCAVFDNIPPGLPGGLRFAARQLRVGRLRRTPLLFGHLARTPLPDELVRAWTEPILRDPGILRDTLTYCRSRFDPAELIRDTEALARFDGEVLVLWSPDNRLMPPEHGRRLAGLMPHARYAEVRDAYVLSPLDQPAAVAAEIAHFLTTSSVRP